MEKMKSSLTNMVLILVSVALIAGALLAWVNTLTQKPIADKAAQTLAGGIKSVMGVSNLSVVRTDTLKQTIEGKEAVFIIHHTVNASGQPLGVAVESTTLGFGGDLRVLVGFNAEGTILGYTILQHSETPGLGAKAQTWFQHGAKGDVIGMTPAQGDLAVSKDGGKVDAITASTITSRAFLKAINQAYHAYQQNMKADAHGVAQTRKD